MCTAQETIIMNNNINEWFKKLSSKELTRYIDFHTKHGIHLEKYRFAQTQVIFTAPNLDEGELLLSFDVKKTGGDTYEGDCIAVLNPDVTLKRYILSCESINCSEASLDDLKDKCEAIACIQLYDDPSLNNIPVSFVKEEHQRTH